MRKVNTLIMLMIVGGLVACGGGGSIEQPSNLTPPAKPLSWQPTSGGNWPVSPPAAEGINQNQLVAAYTAGTAIGGLRALLVLRRGQLVAEAYYGEQNAATLFALGAVTNTVVADLIGIAIAERKISSINQPISDFLSRDYGSLLSNKGDITIAHLLAMSSGISWNETTGNSYQQFLGDPDPTRYVLQQAMLNTPGSRFNYNSGAAHLLSVILTKATGMSTSQYAQKVLFTPLGITQSQWDILADGYVNGAGGLALSARDFAKIAVLWQQQGVWQGKRLLPAGWSETTLSSQQPREQNIGGLPIVGYGFGRWLAKHSQNSQAALAWGAGGQFALVLTPLDATVISLADPAASNRNQQEGNIMRLIYQQLLPAFQ